MEEAGILISITCLENITYSTEIAIVLPLFGFDQDVLRDMNGVE